MKKLNFRLLFPVLMLFIVSVVPLQAQTVGYYEIVTGQGENYQVPPITALGYTPVQLFDLTTADLIGIDILFVTNDSNAGYDAEYLSRLTDIENAVQNGMILIIHDRRVEEANTILPNGIGFNTIRDFSDDADIDILDNTTRVTNGSSGTLNNISLDGGSSSSHGYTDSSTLPGNAVLILSTSTPSHVVTFAYPVGSGGVIYSTIPLDYYLDGSGPNPPRDNFTDIYAPNVIEYANFFDCTAPGITSNPADVTISYGETATLTVLAMGTEPVEYKWFKGVRGDRTDLINNTSGYQYTTPVLESTTSYWVEVYNDCGSAKSQTATVTVIYPAYPPSEFTLQRVENDYIFYKNYINRLSWTENAQNIKPIITYKLYKKVKGSGDDTYQLVEELSGTTFSYKFRGLKKDELFTYKIIAVNDMGSESDPVVVSN